MKSHKICNRSIEGSLPTRLIEIGDYGSSRSSGLKLVFSRNLDPSPKYATLSHRWGGKSSLELSVKNENELLQGIPDSGLCKTFRDAVHVVREMGIRYLWIDRLCIIQEGDDYADGRKESARMRDVYWNAFLNVAATFAADGDEGLFTEHDDPLIFTPCIVQVQTGHVDHGDHTSPAQYNTFKLRHELDRPIRIQSSLVNHGSLNRRCWVLQERFLSRRMLNYCDGRLCWECCETVGCETDPENARDIVGRSTLFLKSKHGYLHIDPDANDDGRNLKVFYDHWIVIVSAYAECSLTKPGDKLPAITGIIKDSEGLLGPNVAGLWKRWMLPQLMWRSYGPFNRPDIYRAPTWS